MARAKGKSRATAVQTVHYRAITVQGLPCRCRAIPRLAFITMLNTMYLVSNVYLDIRWVNTHF
jgi:hypothetical protein